MNLDMQLDVKVSDKSFKGTIRDVLTINEATLSNEFINQPPTYAWFAALSEMASAEVENRKMSLSVLQANLDAEKRIELGATGKVTESMVQSAIIKDKRHQVAHEELIEAERQLGVLKSMVRALEQRSQMLIALGAMKRQEMILTDFGIDMKKVRDNNRGG